MKVLIAGGGTGGHLMPALALADAFTELDDAVEPVLVGAERGVEANILPERAYKHYLLPLHPIYRRELWRNLRWPALVWRVLAECRKVLESEQPAMVVGTGGYVSGPVLFQALRAGLPVGLQEQNAYPGLVTRLLARKARQVHLGFPEAAAHLKLGRNTLMMSYGNPIQAPPSPLPDRGTARRAIGIPDGVPVVFVMGGSQGARAINQALRALVESQRLSDVALLWSTGQHMWQDLKQFHSPPARYVRPFWDPIAEAYAVSEMVVCRAGAMTTAEICAWALPAVLIPLPTAAGRHQARNAEALAAAGAVLHLPESDLSPERLLALLCEVLADGARRTAMSRAARSRGRPDAAQKIASELLAMVS